MADFERNLADMVADYVQKLAELVVLLDMIKHYLVLCMVMVLLVLSKVLVIALVQHLNKQLAEQRLQLESPYKTAERMIDDQNNLKKFHNYLQMFALNLFVNKFSFLPSEK